MCIVSHDYTGGLDGGMDVGGGWYACGTMLRWLVACRDKPEHFPGVR